MADTPPLHREDARITRSRQALHRALLKLVAKQPFDTITIREITDTAGVGYATFYRHYPTKAVLLNDVAAVEIRELTALTLPALDGGRNPREACVAILRYIDLHHGVWRALLNGGAAGTIRDEILQTAREVGDTIPHGGGWLPIDLSRRFVASAMLELLSWWLDRRGQVTVEKGAELLDRLIISPVLASGAEISEE